MSREIKFRAWDKEDKKMWRVVSITESIWGDCEEAHIRICESHENPSKKETDVRMSVDYELMQYTGLKDKNGKEIFEGDIIYWEINNGVGIESYTAVVKWSENLVEEGWNQTYKWLVGYTGDYYRGSYDELSTPAAYNDALQIIGNIYENPELLEETA